MSTNQTLKNLVKSITRGDVGQADSLFKKAILERVKNKLNTLKKEVAKQMFKK